MSSYCCWRMLIVVVPLTFGKLICAVDSFTDSMRPVGADNSSGWRAATSLACAEAAEDGAGLVEPWGDFPVLGDGKGVAGTAGLVGVFGGWALVGVLAGLGTVLVAMDGAGCILAGVGCVLVGAERVVRLECTEARCLR